MRCCLTDIRHFKTVCSTELNAAERKWNGRQFQEFSAVLLWFIYVYSAPLHSASIYHSIGFHGHVAIYICIVRNTDPADRPISEPYSSALPYLVSVVRVESHKGVRRGHAPNHLKQKSVAGDSLQMVRALESSEHRLQTETTEILSLMNSIDSSHQKSY